MTSFMPTLCLACRRLKEGGTCTAFPEGIPEEILYWGADHRSPIEGDHGLQFSQKAGEEAERAFGAWRRTFLLTPRR